jgi:hypothetical protein
MLYKPIATDCWFMFPATVNLLVCVLTFPRNDVQLVH